MENTENTKVFAITASAIHLQTKLILKEYLSEFASTLFVPTHTEKRTVTRMKVGEGEREREMSLESTRERERAKER